MIVRLFIIIIYRLDRIVRKYTIYVTAERKQGFSSQNVGNLAHQIFPASEQVLEAYLCLHFTRLWFQSTLAFPLGYPHVQGFPDIDIMWFTNIGQDAIA